MSGHKPQQMQPKQNDQPEAQSQGDEGQDIHSVVAEHGPAQDVHVMHQNGQHTMHSTHGAHKHKSSHGSAHEAHQAGMTAANAEQPEGDEQGVTQDSAEAPMGVPGYGG